MTIHLVELKPMDPRTDKEVTLRYSTAAYITEPNDAPANVEWDDRLEDAGNYQRYLFGPGRTRGESDIGGGDIVVKNADRALDDLNELAWDGRPVTIYELASKEAPWASRKVAFEGTTEQLEFGPLTATVRIRDRLALLRDAILTDRYLGTTINGGLAIAEGGVDLKDVRKPLLFGRALAIPAVIVDAYDHVFQVSSRPIHGVTSVRDTGVPLGATQDYPTLAALKAAAIVKGKYATCLALGLVRTGAAPDGTLTVDAFEGATLADRSAARIAQRMLAGFASVVADDFAALHLLNPTECGLSIMPGEMTRLAAVTAILASIGGFLTPDRLGRFRVGRLDPPAPGGMEIDATLRARADGLVRSAPIDQGNGVPAISITVRYARAGTVFSATDLKNVASDDAFRGFAGQEFRTAVVESARNKLLYPKGPELVFDTCLLNEADAKAEATRLMGVYGVRRDVFPQRVPTAEVEGIDLNKDVTVLADRFGMAAGAPMRVIGLTESRQTGWTKIEAWR